MLILLLGAGVMVLWLLNRGPQGTATAQLPAARRPAPAPGGIQAGALPPVVQRGLSYLSAALTVYKGGAAVVSYFGATDAAAEAAVEGFTAETFTAVGETGAVVGSEVGATVGAEAASAAAESAVLAGGETATTTGASAALAAAAVPLAVMGGVLILGIAVNALAQGLSYVPGSIARARMVALQEAIRAQGLMAVMAAIRAARNFQDAIMAIAVAPGQGQVQYGIGEEYTGVNDAPGSSTKGWPAIVAAMTDGATLNRNPTLPAGFIANLWVQSGESGAAAFDPGSTLVCRMLLCSKLPYTPAWNAIRQRILNAEVVDPRNLDARDAAYSAVPVYPADRFLRLGWAKLPTDATYQAYQIGMEPPQAVPSTVEEAARDLAGYDPFDPPYTNGHPSLMMKDGDWLDVLGWRDNVTGEVTPGPAPSEILYGVGGPYVTQTHTYGYWIKLEHLDRGAPLSALRGATERSHTQELAVLAATPVFYDSR